MNILEHGLNSTENSTAWPSNKTERLSGTLSATEIVAIVIVGAMVPFICVGNVLVIIVVIRFKRLQIPTNFFIVSLAFTDILIGMTIPFVTATELLRNAIQDWFLCVLPKCAIVAMCAVSVLNLTAIAWDRHLAVANPLEYATMLNLPKIATIITLSWIYSVALALSPFMGWYGDPYPLNECDFKAIPKSAIIVILCALFVPACLVIFFCYFRIYMVARHHARAIAAIEISIRQNLEMHFFIKDTKYAKTLALVIGVFLLLWLPVGICVILHIAGSVNVDTWIINLMSSLAFLNSGINPWIYAYKNKDFRAAYKRLFREFESCCCPARINSIRTSPNVSGVHDSTSGLSRTNSVISGMDLRRLRMYGARNSLADDGTSIHTTQTKSSVCDMANNLRIQQRKDSKKVMWTEDTSAKTCEKDDEDESRGTNDW